MKIRKNSEVKNMTVYTGAYKRSELEAMIEEKRIYDLNKMFGNSEEGEHLVVFMDDCEKIEVKYSKEYDSYYTAVIMKDGYEVQVEI